MVALLEPVAKGEMAGWAIARREAAPDDSASKRIGGIADQSFGYPI